VLWCMDRNGQHSCFAFLYRQRGYVQAVVIGMRKDVKEGRGGGGNQALLPMSTCSERSSGSSVAEAV
jgi:hypothetical protein